MCKGYCFDLKFSADEINEEIYANKEEYIKETLEDISNYFAKYNICIENMEYIQEDIEVAVDGLFD